MISKRKRQRIRRQIKLQRHCPYCGIRLFASNANRDHMIPAARLRKYEAANGEQFGVRYNMVVCCKKCNNKKSFRTPLEYFMGCKIWHNPQDFDNMQILPFEVNTE